MRTSHLTSGKTPARRLGPADTPTERHDDAEQPDAYENPTIASIDADATELTLQTSDVPDLQHQFSQELTIVQRTPKVTWIGGVFLYADHNEGEVEITVFPFATQIRPFAKIGTNAGALFGQATLSCRAAFR